MPRRRSIYSLPRLKLKHKTVVTVGAVISLGFSGLTLVSLFSSSLVLSFWREFLYEYIGWLVYLSPIFFLFITLILFRVKFKVAQMNVFLGFITILISLMGLTGGILQEGAGILGRELWGELEKFLTTPVAFFLLFLTLIAGLVVFFNTSLNQIFSILASTLSLIGKVFVKTRSIIFERSSHTRPMPSIRLSNIDERSKHIKNQGKEEIIADKLVANIAGQNKVWKYPPLSLISDKIGAPADRGDIKKNAAIIEKTLDSFGIQARVAEVNGGPAVTQYALEIASGTKIAKIASLQHDIALALATRTGTVRIEAPIPGKSLVGIEVPNHSLEIVGLKSILASDELSKHKSKLAVALGRDTASSPMIVDLDRMPHVLIAGTTGSGKSVLINAIIASLLFRNSPDQLKLILIDPKRVELTNYNNIPHLLTPVITEPEKILSALKWAMAEMDRRYKLFQSVGVRNIAGYNEMSGFQALPYIVIVVDELADLMMFAPVEVEDAVTRIAQLARATGIHLVLSTQRPSVDVITGLIKANIPCRIAFNVASLVDSRVILDGPGAEKLLGRGDMLFLPPDASKPVRIQGVLLSDSEISSLINFLKSQGIAPEYTEEVTKMPLGRIGRGGGDGERDSLFEEAVRTVCQYDRASASLLQRRLKVGYSRAARIIDELETAGIIGPGDGSKPRDVLVRNAEEYFAATAQNQS